MPETSVYNSITATKMGLIFLLFDVASPGHMPYGLPQYMQCVIHDFIVSSFVSHSSLLTLIWQ